jgi:hypothetical protein
MTRKINVRNIVLIIGVSIFNIACGMYDRIVNDTGTIKWVTDTVTSGAQNVAMSSTWNTTNVNLASSTMSGFNFTSILLIAFVGTVIMAVMLSTVSCSAGMN